MVTSPFQRAADEISGKSWLDELARSSLRAAQAKFDQGTAQPLLRVELRGTQRVGAYDTALVTMALQNATAKLGHVIRDPRREHTHTRRSDREASILIPKAQVGRTLYFSFPSDADADRSAVSLFPEFHAPSLSEEAARELCELLPAGDNDDASLDAVLAQRTTVRSAVSDLVEAISQTHAGLGLVFTGVGAESTNSQLSTEQADLLRDGLKETRTDRRVEQVVGRLDGVRTRRRIFYLETETGQEIYGAIGSDPVVMDSIRSNLDRRVKATIESERS